MTFNQIVDKVLSLWKLQKQKAQKAEKLMNECEGIEKSLNKYLDIAEKEYPEQYQEFVESFGKEKLSD